MLDRAAAADRLDAEGLDVGGVDANIGHHAELRNLRFMYHFFCPPSVFMTFTMFM